MQTTRFTAFLFASLLATGSVASADDGATTTTIAKIHEGARDEQQVRIEAVVDRRLDEEVFVLRDDTGTIRLDTWIEGQGSVPVPVGKRIIVDGMIDRDRPGKAEVYLLSFTEAEGPEMQGNESVGGNESSVRTIADVRRHAAEYETVTIRGRVLKQRGDDVYLVGDETARIKIDAWVDGQGVVRLPVGEEVELTGHVDRNWLRQPELYLHDFRRLERE